MDFCSVRGSAQLSVCLQELSQARSLYEPRAARAGSAQAHTPAWRYDDVLPYFRRSETWEGGADAYRGGDGPLKVRRTRYDDVLLSSFIQAGQQAGYAITRDYNGAEQEGFDFIRYASAPRCAWW